MVILITDKLQGKPPSPEKYLMFSQKRPEGLITLTSKKAHPLGMHVLPIDKSKRQVSSIYSDNYSAS